VRYEYVTDASALGAVANRVEQAKLIGFDIETTSLNPRDGKIRLVQLAMGDPADPDIYVIDLWQTEGLGPVLDAMRATKALFIIHNAKFEQKWFWWFHRFEFWPVFCTFRASAILYNGRRELRHNLDSVIVRELQEQPSNVGQGGSDWTRPNLGSEQLDYAAEDVLRLMRLYKALRQKLVQYGLLKCALIEFGVILPECRTELNGFHLAKDKWLALAEANLLNSKRLKEELLAELPHPMGQMALPGMTPGWNLGSPKQMLGSLHRIRGLHELEDTKEITLAMEAGRFPIIKKILEWRGYNQRVKTFGPNYLRWVRSDTGRIHTEYYALLAAGRYSSSKPNLQQIPRDADYRDCFTAPPGRVLILADYSGIEMRIVAEISNDPELIKVFTSGDDAHYATAAIILEKPVSEVTKAERQFAKPVNFGLIYGMMPAKLVLYAQSGYGVAMSLGQAERYHKRYFDRFRGVARWHNKVSRDGRRQGISRTLSGRLRWLDPQKSWNEFKNCLDAKTEALTLRGWVPGMELSNDDVLLTKNIDTGRLEWQKATEIKKWPDYEGPLIEFRSRSFNAVSTPDHRWMVTEKHSGRAVCRTTERVSLHGDDRIHRTGDYVGPERSEFTDAEVELVGWLVTDGSIVPVRDRGGRPKVVLSQSERAKPENVARIDAALNAMGWGHSRHVARRTECVTWHLHKAESARLAAMFPGRLLSGVFLRQLSRDQINLLFETMVRGDGHREEGGKTTFYAGTKEAADAFGMVATLAGFATNTRVRDMSQYRPKSDKLLNVPKMGLIWVVTVLARTTAQVLETQRRDFRSKQPIWCPIVPNTFFVARREGQVFVTGNTPVQGTGADALKTSMRLVQDRIDKTFGVSAAETMDGPVAICHHVHDEIILECDEDEEMKREASKQLHDGMHEGMSRFLDKVPVVVDPSSGRSWAEAK